MCSDWKGFIPPSRSQLGGAWSTAQIQKLENTHLSMEAIQSETEISTSYQFSLDPQLLTLLSRPCSVSKAQLYITCAQLQTSFAVYIENELHFLTLSECRWVTHFALNKTITAQQICWSTDMVQKASDPLSLALSLKSGNSTTKKKYAVQTARNINSTKRISKFR